MQGTDAAWALQDKARVDQARHRQKLRQALRQELAQLIVEEAVVAGEPGRPVKLPIRVLEQYKFRYHPFKHDQVAMDGGEAKPGDSLALAGKGPLAGDQPGEAVMEAEMDLEEVESLVFSQLGLPDLAPKGDPRWEDLRWDVREIGQRGGWANLDKRRTIRQHLLRQARGGRAQMGRLGPEDLRFKQGDWQEVLENNAVVIAMRDVSGSMGDFKKRMARTFCHWMLRFLRTRYHAVETVFLVHHATAREVGEEEFFRLGESGGTKVSSVYALCREVIAARYPPQRWNLYPIHFSDGDNWSDADNRRTADLVTEMLPWVNAFGYVEIRESAHGSSLLQQLAKIQHPRFRLLTIRRPEDVWPALQQFFPPALAR